MSRNYCNNEEPYCNNNCCNTSNCYGNAVSPFGGSCFYMLAILLLFAGGGFGPSSFWGDYSKIFRCSGFNNAWCNDKAFNNFNNNIFNNNNFSNSLSNTTLSNAGLTGLLGDLSSNNSFNTANITDSYN